MTAERGFLFTILGLLWASGAAVAGTANIRDGYHLHRYDPVSYFQASGPKKGLESISIDQNGGKYLFATEKNREDFLQNPKKFTPEYEGWCATAVAGGYKYDIDPENYKVTNGRLFLFYKGWKGDAKKSWLKDEVGQTKLADQNWPKVKESEE
jgi:YHS domain-containing protein